MDKKLMVSYIPEIRPVYVDFGFLSGNNFKCIWYNPGTGKRGKEFTVSTKTVQKIGPVYGEDWVLMIQGD